jgi:hypothetical protein
VVQGTAKGLAAILAGHGAGAGRLLPVVSELLCQSLSSLSTAIAALPNDIAFILAVGLYAGCLILVVIFSLCQDLSSLSAAVLALPNDVAFVLAVGLYTGCFILIVHTFLLTLALLRIVLSRILLQGNDFLKVGGTADRAGSISFALIGAVGPQVSHGFASDITGMQIAVASVRIVVFHIEGSSGNTLGMIALSATVTVTT